MHSYESTAILADAEYVTASRPMGYFYTENAPRVRERLIYIAKGRISFHCDGVCHTAVAGQCVYLPQGQTIDSSFEGESNWTYTFIFRRIGGTLWDGIRIFPENPTVIMTLHQCAKNETGITNPNYYLSCLYRIIYLLQENSAQENLKILPAIEALRREYQQNEKITKYARMVYMSESQFRKLFRQSVGMTPVDYRNQLRLKQVENLLFSGYTLEEAAHEAGFNSVSYYCRMAKKSKNVL